jgi:hypothetical protein
VSGDERIRDLERAAKNDPIASAKLAREKARYGQPLWIADVLQQAGLKHVALSSIAKGVRAVCKETWISVQVSIWRDANDSYVFIQDGLRCGDSRTREKFRKVFGIHIGPFYHLHREERVEPYERLYYGGPTLASEHQETFLEAVRKSEAKAPDKAPVDRPYRRGDVVTLRRPGARRRYVVDWTAPSDGLLDLIALSGAVKGSHAHNVSPDRVSFDPDQTLEFTGSIADKLRRAYESRRGQ